MVVNLLRDPEPVISSREGRGKPTILWAVYDPLESMSAYSRAPSAPGRGAAYDHILDSGLIEGRRADSDDQDQEISGAAQT